MEFEITAPDGRTLSIEGETMPNEQELEEIFASVKSDFNSSKAKTSDIFSVDDLPSDTPSKLMQVGNFLKEGVAKPVAQGYFNLAKGLGGMMNWYADQSRLSQEEADALGISEDVRQKLNTFSDILNIAGDSVRFGSEEWLEKEWIKSDPEVFKGEFFENPSWTRASAAVASALPSFTSIVAFGKSNFALGYALMAGSENADIYLEAKEKVGEEKASGLFLAGTAGTAAIDIAMKPIEKIIKPLKGGFIDRMAERAIRGGMEALPESLQQVYQNAVKKYGYDATQSLWSGVIESAIGGFGMGAVAAGAEGLIEQGATEEEIEQLQNVAVESIVANSKELNDIAYQDMKKTLTKINEKFANMSEDDVMRIGRELEEGFGKYYRELSEIMPEEQARSNAALIRNHAFFASDAMGISPKEYFDKYAPKIEKTAFSEFGKPKQEAKPYVLSEEELKGVKAPQMTQQDINYAKSHPEWKKNADNIELIERAGASIDDDLETINNALRNYATEDYRYRKEREVNHYNYLASQLSEDEQERLAIMVENGTDADEAFRQIKYSESDAEGLDLTPRQDTYTRIIGTNGQVSYFQDQIKEAQDLSENMEKLDNIYPAYEGETININGQEKTVYNSNGDRIAKSKEALENFYRWFGDSKVVDEQGRPLVVYHGTNYGQNVVKSFKDIKVGQEFVGYGKVEEKTGNSVVIGGKTYSALRAEILANQEQLVEKITDKPIDVFDKKYLGRNTGAKLSKLGFFFSELEEYTKPYGKVSIPVYLKLENPLMVNAEGQQVKSDEFYKTIKKQLKGNDGVVIYNILGEKSGREYVAFNPNQIKSTSNRGTYSLDEENIYYQFAGEKAQIAALDELYYAKLMEQEGESKEKILRDTGWFRGADGKWRFEISDKDAKIKESGLQELNEGNSVRLEDILGHEDLYKAYPALANIEVKIDESLTGTSTGAYVNGASAEDMTIYVRRGEAEESFRKILLHEIQHAIQHIEGFATGGNEYTAINYLKSKIHKVESSDAMWDFQELLDKYDMLKDVSNVLRLEKDPESVAKTSWFYERFLGVPKNKAARKAFLDEKGQEFLDYLMDKYRQSNAKLDQYYEYLEKEKPEIDKMLKSVSGKIDRLHKKLYTKDYASTKHLLNRYKNGEISAFTLYERLAGEIEARNTEKRADMTDEQRRAESPESTQDVKNADAIVVFDDGTAMAYKPEVIQKFYQDEQAPRGAFANDTIYLFENANESTLPHELTHSWQKELRRINETNPTEKLTGMLEQIDNWTSSEFTRKYNVSKRNYGYAVIDKRGNVVYDNRGDGFLTEQDAVEYAKDEIFARGFEQYVREGKAPNNSLKQAFRNFFLWLKKIYRDAMDLNIQLSPDIKNVYADLLGGVDVDFFLDATPESFIQQRIKLGEQREKTLDGIIQDAQANKQRVVKTKRGKGFSRVWATAMIPLSTRAKRISPKLRNVLRKYEFTLSNELNKKYDKVRPFMDLWKNMSEDDIIAFDFALKNDYVAKQLEIVDKYNARKEWEAVRETLENIYDEALNAGLDINWRPDYFPRKVKDVDGFLSYLHNAPEWTRFQQAISEAGLDGATAEEQAEFLNKYLRGFVKVDLMPNKYGSEKERKIDIIDNEMNQFYAPSIEALVGYIEGLNSRIVSSKFLGKGDNIEESIGGYLTYLLNNNIIAPEQIDEARNILRARFDARGVSNPWLANMRNYSYMYTMGGINSAITQIEDLSVAMYKAGVWNTLTTAMESKRITKKDLGLTSISAEFVEQSKSAAYLGKLFKLTGLDGIDSFGKETLVNAELKKFQKMSDETLREYIEPIMEEETNATIQDIRNNNISDNVLYLMFSELSDVQPISLSELPEFYNRGGNLRVLYMLKSFALKRIDIFRNECVDKIKSKDFNQVKEGMQNLLKLSALMVICGSSKDWLIDLLYGRETDMSERVLNNILGLVGLSKFQIYQAKEKGFTGTVKDIVVPPLFAVFDDLFTDVAKGVQGKREIKDFEVWKGIPLVGRFYYWWVGRGSEKQKKKKKY